MTITVYGASDDLIEIEGDISEEFPATSEAGEKGDVLAFSTGVVLRVRYDEDGCWRIVPLAGASRVTITFADGPDTDNYSDRAEIHDDQCAWVVHGTGYAKNPNPDLR